MNVANPFRRRVLGPSRTFLAIVGVVAAAVVGFALYVGPTAVNGIPGIHYDTVRVMFNNADTLQLHDRVRIAGVDVGQVAGTSVLHGQAVVSLQLNPGTKLRRGTIVRVRPQSAVGTRFVELDPSEHGPMIPDNGVIPASHTRVEVPLTDVLDVFAPQERTRSQTLLRQLGAGVAGRGEDINTTLYDLPPTLGDLQGLASAIDARGGFAPLIASAQGAANAADPVREAIADGFHPEAMALKPFADNPTSLDATLDVAPRVLRASDTGLRQSSPLLNELTRFARAAVPALGKARSALTQTSLLLTEGQPGLRAAPPVLALVKPATPATLDLLDTLTPVLPDVDTAVSASLPIATDLAPRGCDIDYWTRNWASAVSWGDGYSNYLRFDLVAPDQTSVAGEGGAAANIHSDPYPAPCQAEKDIAP